MTRAYLRLDPGFFERKRIQQGYSAGQFSALTGALCQAETQPERGRFRDERVLRALLGADGREVPFLLSQGDLVRAPDGRIYIEGWDEWQEGDVTVRDRVRKIRTRRGGTELGRSPGAVRTANYRLRKRVFERDQYLCRYCGRDDYPRDWLVLEHVDPDGPTTEENLVTACRSCNKLKGPRTPEQAGMKVRAAPSPNVTNGAARDASREAV